MTETTFGFAPIPADKLDRQDVSVRSLFKMVMSGKMPHRDPSVTKHLLEVSGIFSRAGNQSDPSWFLEAELLGHPSPALSSTISKCLFNISRAVKAQNMASFVNEIEAFKSHEGHEMLHSYIEGRKSAPVAESGWAYAIQSRANPGILAVDVTEGGMRSVISDRVLNVSAQQAVLVGAWLVNDVDDARAAIETAMSGTAVAPGKYFCQVPQAKEKIEQALKDSGDYVMSAWHTHDQNSQSNQQSFSR